MKFELIYKDLYARIRRGEFSALGRLPTEEALSRQYYCSRPTLRKALIQLDQEGMILRRQGSGSYITEPGEEARNAQKGKYLFGTIFPGLGSHYVFNSIASEIAVCVTRRDSSLIWGGALDPYAPHLMDDVKRTCRKYLEEEIHGLFYAPIEYTPLRDQVNQYVIDTFLKEGVHVVLIDSDVVDFPRRSGYDLVSLDHIQSSYTIASHMISRGASELHFLFPPHSTRTMKLRLVGFHAARVDHGLHTSKHYVHEGDPRDERLAKDLARQGAQGVLCSNDGSAIQFMDTLSKIGLKVPEDLLVGGFDNLGYLNQLRIPLTSVSQPQADISYEAVQIMMDRVLYPQCPVRTLRFPGTLHERRSTCRDTGLEEISEVL